jgi:hypothetical protein
MKPQSGLIWSAKTLAKCNEERDHFPHRRYYARPRAGTLSNF